MSVCVLCVCLAQRTVCGQPQGVKENVMFVFV